VGEAEGCAAGRTPTPKREKIMRKIFAVVSAVLLGLASSVQAAVPTGVETVFTGLATDFGTIVGYGWTLFLVIVGGLALFGIVRRIVGKTAH